VGDETSIELENNKIRSGGTEGLGSDRIVIGFGHEDLVDDVDDAIRVHAIGFHNFGALHLDDGTVLFATAHRQGTKERR